MSDDLQPSVVSKKRDASSPLQNPSDSYKRTKQAQQASEKLLSDINDSYTAVDETLHTLNTSALPDLPDSDDSVISVSSETETTAEKKQNMSSRLSEEDIDRIALAVRSIMIPDIEATIDKRIGVMKSQYDAKIKGLQTDNTKLQSRVDELETENADLRADVADMQNEIDDVKWRGDELEQYSRRNSFRISGISEDDPRSTDQIAIDIANKYEIDIDIRDIDRSHRVGTKTVGKTRAILIKCTSYRAKRAFMEKKQDLGDDLYFNDDLTRHRSSLLYKARRIFKADRLNGAWSYNGKVYIKDAKDVKHEVKSESAIDELASKNPINRKKDTKSRASSEPPSAAGSSASTHTPMVG